MRFTLFTLALVAVARAQIPSPSSPSVNAFDTVNQGFNDASSANALYLAIRNALTPYLNPVPGVVFANLMTALKAIPIAGLTASNAAVTSAFASAALAVPDAQSTNVALAQACFDQIVQQPNKIIAFNVCEDISHHMFLTEQTMFNNIIEQFVAILPPSALGIFQSTTATYFNALVSEPNSQAMLAQINNALISVVATASAETVTAIELLEQCIQNAFNVPGIQPCLLASNAPSPFLSISNVLSGVLQQFVGYLPPNLILDAENIYLVYFATPGSLPGYGPQVGITNAITSVSSSLSGSAVTYGEQLQACIALIIMAPNPAAVNCLVAPNGPAYTLLVLINSILQQGLGYLPPTLIIATQAALQPLIVASPAPASSALTIAMQNAVTASRVGPVSVTCTLVLQNCILAAAKGYTGTCNFKACNDLYPSTPTYQ